MDEPEVNSESAEMADWTDMDRVFAVTGQTMRAHRGRSVVRLNVAGRAHYLKRFWFTPSRALKRYIARGIHELRMIDWLASHGFGGPRVVARGRSGVGPIATRLFFLMEEVPGELDLERFDRLHPDSTDALVLALAEHTARLHDAGFHHYDYMATHILVGQGPGNGAPGFRLIDVERARATGSRLRDDATDLNKLLTSVGEGSLRTCLERTFLDGYLSCRTDPPDRRALSRLMRHSASSRRYGNE